MRSNPLVAQRREDAAEKARAAAFELAERARVCSRTPPLGLEELRAQFRLLIDKVMGEAALFAPEAAALALKQAEGDVHEAVVILRGYRQVLRRGYTSEIIDTREMFVQRRISSAFREIPGGQVLGPTLDYSQRLLEGRLASETMETVDGFLREFLGTAPAGPERPVRTFGKVSDLLLAQGLLKPVEGDGDRRVQDLTREPALFPVPRSARLQALARAETGAIMALAYSGMRGQGGVHPTIGEVRVGLVEVSVTDSRGRRRSLGRIQVTECEAIAKMRAGRKNADVPYLSLGYGLCLGQNETKAICMGMLDRGLRDGVDTAPAVSAEFVIYHTEGAEAWGGLNSLQLPAHVDFAAELSLLREARRRRDGEREVAAEARRLALSDPPA